MQNATVFPLSRYLLRALFLAFSGMLYTSLAFPQANPKLQLPEGPSTLVVSVRLPDGLPLDTPAIVNLYTASGIPAGIAVLRSGTAEFGDLAPASYTLEIVAAKYQRFTQNVLILTWGQRQQLSVVLTPESVESKVSPTPGQPRLAPHAEKEVSKALEDLRADKPQNARKHLEKASYEAPSHPDVSYLWGMYYAQLHDFTRAKLYWQRVVQVAPQHAYSLHGLAQLALQNSDYAAATEYLLRAAEADPSSWRYHEQLAETYSNQKQYEQALTHAQRALELGKERAAEVQFVLAQIFIHDSDTQAALQALDAFLTSHPSKTRAKAARDLADELRGRGSPAGPDFNASLTWDEKSSPFLPPAAELMPRPNWMPPDVDDNMPPVEPTAGCPLQTIQREAGKRVDGFVDAVNRIAATESLENELINRSGQAVKHTLQSFSYVASVEQTRPGFYTMDEYRNGSMDLDQFPEGIATLGLSALVMVFHPLYVENYDLVCEGLSRRGDGLAWQVHFRQKPDMPARLRTYRVDNTSYPIALRGRAWISTDTFQVERLETDLVSPVPKIRLRAEHISVAYRPVEFLSHHAELWLPESADIYFDFAHHRMHRRHEFRDYMLFAVDEQQQISLPATKANQP